MTAGGGSEPVVVVKVGGSLLDWPGLPGALRDHLGGRLARGERPVVVAGGGRAADAVRELDRVHRLGEAAAHALALRALDFTAHALAALVPGLVAVDDPAELEPAWDGGRVPVLAPRRSLDADDARGGPGRLPHAWSVTSDSIAARLAARLGAAEVCLLKSAGLPPGTDRAGAARLGLVDAYFPIAARPLARVTYLNLRDPLAALGEIGPGAYGEQAPSPTPSEESR